MLNIQNQGKMNSYTLEDLYPYPFDQLIVMLQFLPHFVVPKFDKYRGKTDPIEHIREFFTSFINVANDELYFM